MGASMKPERRPNLEYELAMLANEAMENGADPKDVTEKLRRTIAYLRQYPKMAEHAENALADGVASPAEITRQIWPHANAIHNAANTPSEPTEEESAGLGGSDSMAGAGLRSLAATGANIAQGIPGMERVQAHIRGMVRRQPYREALSDIRGDVNRLPTSMKYAERAVGAIPTAAILPGGAVRAGALAGAATGALDADHDLSMGERVGKTALHAAGGALLGKGAQMVGGIARAAAAPNPARLLLQKQAERAGAAKQLYGAALREGQGKAPTPELQKFLAEPDIAEIVTELQASRQFANAAPESPEMLDALYKTLSDRAGMLKRGLAAVNPSRPNIGRFREADTRAAQQQALQAMEGTPSVPGPMPTYPKAVQDFAQRTREIEAAQRGYDALRQNLSGNLPTAKNLTRKTPEAFAEWAAKASPQEQTAARQGIGGAMSQSFGAGGLTMKPFRNALSEAPDLLRAVEPQSAKTIRMLRNLGFLTGGDLSTPQR